MTMPVPRTKFHARYTMAHHDDGYKFKFFCAFCDYHYTTGWIKSESPTEARRLAEAEARINFNGCYQCGRWVCNEHYNIEKMMCVECATHTAR